MADRKISELTNITGANLADTDEFVVVDTSASETKAITYGELKKFTGTVTADGLTVDGTTIASSTNPDLYFIETDTTDLNAYIANGSGNFTTYTANDAKTSFKQRINLDHSTGDISFYEDTGTTPKMVWSASAETLSIGTYNGAGTPSGSLFVDSNANNHAIHIEETGGGSESWQIGVNTDGDLGFYNSQSTTASITFDDSGNMLMGRTDTSSATAGTVIYGGSLKGAITQTFAGRPLYINRLTSDGDIIEFAKDGTTVGSIGTANVGDLYIGNDDTTLLFAGGSDAILPRGTAGASRDAAVSLGLSSNRFKDLYLSGAITLNNASMSSVGTFGRNTDASARTLFAFRSESQNATVGTITVTNSATAYNTSSDYRLKENVVDLTGATDRIKQIPVHRFNFIADPDATVDGFLAHEVQEIVPEAVTGTKDAMRTEEYEVTPAVVDDDGNVVTEAVMGTREVPDYQGIDQSKLVPLLTAALQEALTEIAALKDRVAALEA